MPRPILATRGGGGVSSGTLNWDAASGVTQYVVKWGTTSGSYTNANTLSNVTSYAFSSFSPPMSAGTTYYVTVKGYDGVNESDFWSEVVVLNGAQIG